MANATFHLRSIEHLNLNGTEIGYEMLSSLLHSCGPLKDFKYRPAGWNIYGWPSRTRETADITAGSILDALRPHANTLKALELNIMENVFRSGRREQLKSMRHFETLKYLALDSFCYDGGQSLGRILPGRLETIEITCMHETMHEDILELARSANWLPNLNTVNLYPWPNSTSCPTSILKISTIAEQFRQRNVVFSFSHGTYLNRASEEDCTRFLTRLAPWCSSSG
ncbi:hypothetical protein JMJ77_0004734 [Colletotrichum scovillei]|uniref:Uncharacterized protein n=1 Tax=Colletotrichum scovillei TaxID=1209932 RepID=A0A9P7RI08_9PEZI|nr:hypothetical protein JMJ77_0004734 [Colletotrichum scovillei]KAG7075941.1 hypothetical protein JMJ76_0013214 [Colletotrichum scovillei]KAG7083122.1 hypothetical protein JMJ78_0008572 [Colletotrichum scovillei]